jgi:hypothetical protein
VGTEDLVLAMLWLDDAHELRRQGITYARAAEQLATLPRTEQAIDGAAIAPLEAESRRNAAGHRAAALLG